MEPPTTSDFSDLQQRVEQLESLLHAQADYQRQLLAFGAPAPQADPETSPLPEPEKLYTRSQAADLLSIGVSSFDRYRREGLIKTTVTLGTRGHRYSIESINQLRDHLEPASYETTSPEPPRTG